MADCCWIGASISTALLEFKLCCHQISTRRTWLASTVPCSFLLGVRFVGTCIPDLSNCWEKCLNLELNAIRWVKVSVPAAAYYSAQTQRAVENFPVSGWRLPPALIRAMGWSSTPAGWPIET